MQIQKLIFWRPTFNGNVLCSLPVLTPFPEQLFGQFREAETGIASDKGRHLLFLHIWKNDKKIMNGLWRWPPLRLSKRQTPTVFVETKTIYFKTIQLNANKTEQIETDSNTNTNKTIIQQTIRDHQVVCRNTKAKLLLNIPCENFTSFSEYENCISFGELFQFHTWNKIFMCEISFLMYVSHLYSKLFQFHEMWNKTFMCEINFFLMNLPSQIWNACIVYQHFNCEISNHFRLQMWNKNFLWGNVLIPYVYHVLWMHVHAIAGTHIGISKGRGKMVVSRHCCRNFGYFGRSWSLWLSEMKAKSCQNRANVASFRKRQGSRPPNPLPL